MRPRKRINKPLPPNLYSNNNCTTYRYRHPHTGQFFGMGSDRSKAIRDAKELNAVLMVACDNIARVLGQETLDDHIDWFYREIIPEREYAANTLGMYKVNISKLRKRFGKTAVIDITVQDISKLLEEQTVRASNQLRQVAVDIFKVAMSRGICETNPAELALKRKEKKTRKRLTLSQYKAIYSHADLWFKNAMDIALITLQRREDIANMKFADIKDNTLYVVQKKTEKYDTGYIAITIGIRLAKVLTRCKSDLASPYLVHRKPVRKIKRESVDHWTQVTPEYITREFARLRDKAIKQNPELFKGMEGSSLPTFHEIRALGIKLYRDQGLNPQTLAGHADEQMTNNYDSDHEDIRWMEAEANLVIEELSA